jgi:hypothetical protein
LRLQLLHCRDDRSRQICARLGAAFVARSARAARVRDPSSRTGICVDGD